MRVSADHATLTAPHGVVDGDASYELLASPTGPSRTTVLHVHFRPGARTRWHTHPLGQVLVVTSGAGWVQSLGRPPQRVVAGDVVHVEPGEEHWHGAGRHTPMSHLVVQAHDEHHRETDVLGPVTEDGYPSSEEHPA